MDSIRYIGLDLHRDTISAAVLDGSGALMIQSVLATRASAVIDFLSGIKGTLHVTFEECSHSAWLYDLLISKVANMVVCNPRKNALLKFGSKSDATGARKLAELLRAGMLAPVYHGENSVLEVQHLTRCYGMLTDDTTRVMSRLKAVFRSQAVACAGKRLYGNKHRDSYLKELGDGPQRKRADYLYQELDVLQKLRRQARRELIVACRKTSGGEMLAVGAVLGASARGGAAWTGQNALPLPHQAPVLGLLRAGCRDPRQRRISRRRRADRTKEEAGTGSRVEPESQP